MLTLVETRISNQVTRIADQAVREALLLHTDRSLTKTEYIDGGDLTILTVDHILLNELRLAAVDAINEQITALDKDQLAIPLGSATGLDLLSGLGPGVPVHVLSVAEVSADFRSEFQGAGINQTLHRMMLDVEVTTRLLLPGCRSEVTVSVPICVAETLIIGSVPDRWVPYQP